MTQLHPFGLIAVLVLGVALILLPRRHAIFPMILLACVVPSAQRLVLMGMDFSLLRVMVLFGWTRLCLRSEFRGFRWNRLDTALLCWMISGTVIFVLQQGEVSALINRLGWMFDGCGMYFLFRCVLVDWEDLERTNYCFILISVPIALAFSTEYLTGRNLFAFLGGVPSLTMVREGRLRCQGAFAHPILAGCFWATVMPFMAYFFAMDRKWLATLGLGAAVLIIVACSSSTPIMSVIFMTFGMSLFAWRRHLGYFRWGFVGTLLFLHLIMQKPVWHLMARANAIGGSTGWHRYKIMDATINNFSEWAFWGERDPMRWGVWEMRDITNQYILEALRGGLVTLVLFVVMLGQAFGMVGKALDKVEGNRPRMILIWCVGIALFGHVVSFYGVSYFGQIIMLVFLTLAMIGSIHTITERASYGQALSPLQSESTQTTLITGPFRRRGSSEWS